MGCASTTAAPTSPPTATSVASAEDIAPLPYTPEQIRDGCPRGRTIVFRIEAEGKPPIRHVIRFDAVDDDGTETLSHDESETGAPMGEAKRTRARWVELQHHADAPRATTKITDADVTVAAGTFRTKLYSTHEKSADGDTSKQLWFAVDHPGPPVKMIVESNGKRVMTMTMIADSVEP